MNYQSLSRRVVSSIPISSPLHFLPAAVLAQGLRLVLSASPFLNQPGRFFIIQLTIVMASASEILAAPLFLSSDQGFPVRLRAVDRLERVLNDRLGCEGLVDQRLDVVLGSLGEVGRLDSRRLLLDLLPDLLLQLLPLRAATLDQGLSLGGVVAHVLLGDLGSLLGVLLGDGAELGGLGVDDLAGVLELGVDELLVGGVDERGEEDDRGGDHGQAPVGDDLDEVVRDEGGESGLGWVG